MNDLSKALTTLSAMITPAVLIMASGSLILTTSQRLGRVIERTRKVTSQFEELALSQLDPTFMEEKRAALFDQLGRTTTRARLLQRAMTCLYLTLSAFVATSAAIGIVAISGMEYTWVPILFGIAGVGLLFYASLLLIAESRVALAAVDAEMDFVLRFSAHFVPEEITKRPKTRKRWLFK